MVAQTILHFCGILRLGFSSMLSFWILLCLVLSPALKVQTLQHDYTAQLHTREWKRAAGHSAIPVSLSDQAVTPTRTQIGATPTSKQRRVAILVCPAQFCVPSDYKVLIKNLMEIESDLPIRLSVDSFRTCPLSRTDWIKVARQLPTRAFLEAQLDVSQTLNWYFESIENGLSEIFACEGEDVNVCFVGHSIGGWVARAYLGGLSQSSSAVHRLALERCSSLITLGTPNVGLETALVDQTRGLLRAIAESPSCSPKSFKENLGISMTCVCSNGIRGFFSSDSGTTSSNNILEPLIATGSYFPLTGKWSTDEENDECLTGDGIVPISSSFLEYPANRVLLEKCLRTGEVIRHSHVVPTPWNLWNGKSPSITLPEDSYPSYVSRGVVEQWAKFIE